MNIHHLDPFFKPQRIALLGVTPNPKSVGGMVLSNLVSGGFQGVVYPINKESESVMGIPCFEDLRSLPKPCDLAVISSAAERVPDNVRACGEAGINGVIILSAGFSESGEGGASLERRIDEERSRFPGMRIVGPNCLGLISPKTRLNISFASGMPLKGDIGFISQSGALCTSVLDWAQQEKVGFSHFISVGNALDVGFGDLIDYLGEDENTHSILLYIESVRNARKFMTAARAFARTKPIIVYKAGRFAASAKAASSHTGAMVSPDDVYDAAFGRIGLARVYDIGDIFDCAELVSRRKWPHGPRLGMVTNGGGPGVMATDALIDSGGELASLSEETMDNLNACLPPMWSGGNPVDVLGDARSKRIGKAVSIVLKDPGVDALLVILTPQAMTNPTSAARILSGLAQETAKPILAAWLGGPSMAEGNHILNSAGVATYMTPEQAVRAFMTLVRYSRNLESLYETPKDIPVTFPLDRKKVRSCFATLLENTEDVFVEDESKQVLGWYGIPVAETETAGSAAEAVKLAAGIDGPVVLKIRSPDIIHKSDIGGVELGLEDDEAVGDAFRRITRSAAERMPEARIQGVTVQPLIRAKDSVEMIIGVRKDPVFGTVIMAGAGGTLAELTGDRQIGFPPLNERLARRMLESLRLWPLLSGYRGHPPVDVGKLIDVLIRLSYLAADHPEIQELDINPLLVTPNEVTALDARIILDREVHFQESKPYEHLALRPYPEEYVKPFRLSAGQNLIFRPIKPEDEPLWFELLDGCSRESIYMRFRYAFQWRSHEVASRFCFIDYEREIAIVPEYSENGCKQLLGVGRLVADPNHETVEYAILVADEWQGRGLGSMLTDYCIDIAREWGCRRIVAQTTTDNPRMIAVFRRRGFEVHIDHKTALVDVSKVLDT